MRKSQREIKSLTEIVEVLDKCPTIRLGINDGEFPYVVPLSFGWELADGMLRIYFHCAKAGKKIELLEKNNAVAVEADVFNGYVKSERGVTVDYESVMAYGRAHAVRGEAAAHGLELLLSHCGASEYSARECVNSDIVAVYRIDIEKIFGKKRFFKNDDLHGAE